MSLTPEYLCLQGWPTFNDFHSSSIQWPQGQGQWGLLAAQHSLSCLRPEMWENLLALPTQYQVWGHRVITMKEILTKSSLDEKLINLHLPHSIGPIFGLVQNIVEWLQCLRQNLLNIWERRYRRIRLWKIPVLKRFWINFRNCKNLVDLNS